jgi:hypothetical protein
MPVDAEGGWWAAVWRKLTTMRPSFGVVGHVVALALATVVVLGFALRLLSNDPWVNVPVLAGMALIAWLVRDVIMQSFSFGRDRPEYAALKGEQTVALFKLQGSKQKPIDVTPAANVAAPVIESAVVQPKIEDKSGEAAQ